jgi:predicted dehydrogenase
MTPSAAPTAVVVGTGFIGPVHVEALRRLGVRVKGVVGSTPEKAAAAAERLGLELGYPSYEAALADPGVTAVHLASPNHLHRPQALAALAAGKHVVCEKPLGLNSRETAELAAAAAAHPRLVCAVNYNMRFYPLALHAREMVRSGEVGDLFHVQGSYVQDWLLHPTDYNWRVLAEHSGVVRAVGDIGTHWLDLVSFVCGLAIDEVMADLRTVHPVRYRPPAGSLQTFVQSGPEPAPGSNPVPVDTEDYGSVLLRFRGGARGAMTVSQVTAGRKNCVRFEIAGSKCALAWNSERPNELWIGRRGAANQVLLRDPSLLAPTAARFADYPGGHNEGYPSSFKQLYRAIYADIAAGGPSAEPLYTTFADGHREMLLCDAIAESHRRSAWMKVGA